MTNSTTINNATLPEYAALHIINNTFIPMDIDPLEVEHRYDDTYDTPEFLRININTYTGHEHVGDPIYNGDLHDTAIAQNKKNTRRWWHGIGRYIAGIIVLLIFVHIDKKIEDEVYYDAHYEWYTDQISDAEYNSILSDLHWH